MDGGKLKRTAGTRARIDRGGVCGGDLTFARYGGRRLRRVDDAAWNGRRMNCRPFAF